MTQITFSTLSADRSYQHNCFAPMAMTDPTDTSMIFIIEDGTDLSASIGVMLEAADHQVKRVYDAACFSSQFLEQQNVRPSDIVMINLEGNRKDNFLLLNLLLAREQGPAVIVMADQYGTVRHTDQFSQTRFQVMAAPIRPDVLLRAVEAVI